MNPKAFYDAWRKEFGALTQERVEGINALIAEMEARGWDDPRWWAYTLATAWHETGKTMRPLEEYGRGKGRPYGVPNAATGHTYFGRGFVQLTWWDNYRKLGDALGLDLVNRPELALDPVNAAQIMCEGMEQGLFTGTSLSRYFNAHVDDPVNARRIVNGTDRAQQIADYHEKALRAVNAGMEPDMAKPPLVDQITSLPTRKVGAAGIVGAILTYVVEHQTELATAIPAVAPMLPVVGGLAPIIPFVVAYFVRERAR